MGETVDRFESIVIVMFMLNKTSRSTSSTQYVLYIDTSRVHTRIETSTQKCRYICLVVGGRVPMYTVLGAMLSFSPGCEVDVRLLDALAQVVVQREHVVLDAFFDP